MIQEYALKGWISDKGKMVMKKTRSDFRPYHMEIVTNDPKTFGLTDKKIMEIIAKHYKLPIDDEEVITTFEMLQTGVMDEMQQVKEYVMKQGWASVVFDGVFSTVENPSVKVMQNVAKTILKNYDFARIGRISFEPKGIFSPKNDLMKVTNLSDLETFARTGRVAKRTEIGRTMAAFREDKNHNNINKMTYTELLSEIAKRSDRTI